MKERSRATHSFSLCRFVWHEISAKHRRTETKNVSQQIILLTQQNTQLFSIAHQPHLSCSIHMHYINYKYTKTAIHIMGSKLELSKAVGFAVYYVKAKRWTVQRMPQRFNHPWLKMPLTGWEPDVYVEPSSFH